MKNDWRSLRDEVVAFRDARDWKQFHTPKNLVAGLAIEAAELQEQFLWCTDAECEARIHDKARRKAIAEELADVVICVDLIAARFGINLWDAILDKFNATSHKTGLEVWL